MSERIQRPKGTADVIPSQAHIWHYLENMLRETAHLFGFEEMRTPVFEHTEVFNRGVGETTDVVQKEMYTFEDKGGRSITLKPEGTAGTVRAYLENGLQGKGAPFKCFYITPVFRYEKPQAGRLREHHQFGVECFGADSFAADSEIISLVYTFLKKLDVDSKVKINSIGCPKCRPIYNEALRKYLEERKDGLCETCRDRLDKNPMRVIDCKVESCKEIVKGAPRTIDFLCDECRDHFEGVKNSLTDMGIPFEIDTDIVRGLDYYTKTVFEFIGMGLGSQSTVCGGGRYDGLVQQLGGQPTSGIGFGCGLERLIMTAEAAGHKFPEPFTVDIVLVSADEKGARAARKLAFELRQIGVSCEIDLCGRGVKAQMKHADRINAKHTAVIGETELESGKVNVKIMATGENIETELSPEGIAKVVR